ALCLSEPVRRLATHCQAVIAPVAAWLVTALPLLSVAGHPPEARSRTEVAPAEDRPGAVLPCQQVVGSRLGVPGQTLSRMEAALAALRSATLRSAAVVA